MLYDGTRALVLGDYTTPSTGPYEGQLGPWADLVSAIGIDPRSLVMKTLFVTSGLFGALAGSSFFLRHRLGPRAVAAFSFGTLWYLPFGTFASIVELVLVWRYAFRRSR